MTKWHVATILIGALLAGLGVYAGHCSDVMPLATLIVGGAMGNATQLKWKDETNGLSSRS